MLVLEPVVDSLTICAASSYCSRLPVPKSPRTPNLNVPSLLGNAPAARPALRPHGVPAAAASRQPRRIGRAARPNSRYR